MNWIRLSELKEWYLFYKSNKQSFRQYIDRFCQNIANWSGKVDVLGKNNTIIKKYIKIN